jgi:hypothetical protein
MVIAGFEALLMRIQLAVPNNHFVSPQVFNQLFTMHGTTMVFFVGMPILFGFGNYLVPLMIGARDMAFPRLNAFSFWISAFGGSAALLQLLRSERTLRRRQRARRGLVRLRAAHRADILARSQHRLLDARRPPQRHRHHRHGDQYCGHDDLHAVPRHEAKPDAAAGLALPGHVLHGVRCDQPAHRRADHADARPLCRIPLLRYPGRRLGRALDALLLDIRASRGLHTCNAGVCLRQ